MIPTLLQITRHDRDDGSRPRWTAHVVGARGIVVTLHKITSQQLIGLERFRNATAKRGLRFNIRMTRANRNEWHGAVAAALRSVR